MIKCTQVIQAALGILWS